MWVSVCDVCVYESLSVCVCLCLPLVKVFTVDIVNEVARRPPKSPVLIVQLPRYSAY